MGPREDPTSTTRVAPATPGIREGWVRSRAVRLLIVGHVVVWGAVVAFAPPEALYGDIGRFAQLVTTPGIPYRDFPTEYAPLQTLLIEGFLRADLLSIATRVALISLVCDLGIAVVLARYWGERSATGYLLLALPLQVFMPHRVDYLPTLLAVWSAGLLRTRDPSGAGLLMGAAVLFKVWPLVLLPTLFRYRPRALATLGAAVLLGVMVWLMVTGPAGARQVATFRGATGWHIEGTVGSTVWILTGEEPRVERGTLRVGTLERAHSLVLAAMLFAVLVAVWRAQVRRGFDPSGLPAVASVSALLVLSPVSSPQYLAWLVPWVAVMVARDRSPALTAALGATVVLAASSFVVYWGIAGGWGFLRAVSFLRAACLAACAGLSMWYLYTRRPEAATVGSPSG
jgi:hypothetical protein